jgi:hypothetical protein
MLAVADTNQELVKFMQLFWLWPNGQYLLLSDLMRPGRRLTVGRTDQLQPGGQEWWTGFSLRRHGSNLTFERNGVLKGSGKKFNLCIANGHWAGTEAPNR